MNIILPIGGLGERFKKEKYNKPKPLISFLGRPLIFWLLDNLKVNEKDSIHIPYNSELDNFRFKDLLKNEYPNLNFFFYKIDFLTRGASETVYVALNNFTKNQLQESVLIIDSDNIYFSDVVGDFRKINDNCIFYFNDFDDSPIYSYIKTKNEYVLDIAEKIKISNNANCGVYGFAYGLELKNTIEKIIDKNIKINNEFYISNLYKEFLSNKIKIKSKYVEDFICLGTPELLKVASFKIKNNDSRIRFCFDLDNTLVTYPKTKGDYSTVQAIQKNINLLNFLHSLGHTIIIHTARRMKTHGGNVGRVVSDIAEVTLDTLKKFNINFDEIYFGKPHADFYIDDLAVNAFYDIQKEIGFYDLNIEPRSHNFIQYTQNSVIKKSTEIQGLVYYNDFIPENHKRFYPKILSKSENSIEMERINGITLSQLYVNNCFLLGYIDKIFEYLNIIHNTNCDSNIDIYQNYAKKIKDRLINYRPNFDDSLFQKEVFNIIELLSSYEKNKLGRMGVIHGDLVFTNIILDENNNLKFIDMRGKQGDQLSIYGDIFYDYAKLYQSLIGYDEILNEKDVNAVYKNKIINYFEKKFLDIYSTEELKNVKNITKSLIVSLLPIHNNEKCHDYYNLIKRIEV